MQPSRESVKLVANDERTAFTLRQDGETVAITPKMVEKADPFDQQTVTIAYTVNDGGQFDTTAQQHFDYADADEEGRIKLDLAAIKQAHPSATTVTVYVIRMVAPTLVGTVSLADSND